MKRIINVLLILCIAVIIACKKDSQSQLPLDVELTLLPGTLSSVLTTINFPDNNVGYVADYIGHISKTVDGGQSWTPQNTGETTPVNGLWFLNTNIGYAVGGETSCNGAGCVPPGGYVLQTVDGGQHWARIFTVPKIALYDICFINANTGYAIALQDVYKTIDGGKTWTAKNIPLPESIMTKIRFADALHGYIVTSKGYIVTTTNGGNSWQLNNPYNKAGYTAIVAGPGYAYAAGSDKIIKSTDNGHSWWQLPSSRSGVNALYFTDANSGISFGMGNYTGGDWGYYRTAVYRTRDGGQTWAGKDDAGDFSPPKAVSFPTKNTGYGVTGSRVFKITVQ